jgi:hypothetical protein
MIEKIEKRTDKKMKLKECKECYYGGREKCFLYDEKYENLNIKECCEGFIDPYTYLQNSMPHAICRDCHYYQTEQCMGNEIALENCIMRY